MNKPEYRRSLLWGLPIATAIGAILGPVFAFIVNARQFLSSSLIELVFWMVIGAVFGLLSGVATLLGGYWRVTSRSKAADSTPNKRIKDARIGAALGSGIGWVLFAVTVGLLFPLPPFIIMAALLALTGIALSALVAGWLVASDERRRPDAAAASRVESPQ